YPSLISSSICELPFTATPSTPFPNPQVHERLPLRMVPHTSCLWITTQHPTAFWCECSLHVVSFR
ncbi:hypothetical protein K443DRAFT_105548, partial [Laccaria amethystina LaAM-08-1]